MITPKTMELNEDLKEVFENVDRGLKDGVPVSITVDYQYKITNVFRDECIILRSIPREVDIDIIKEELKRRRFTFVFSRVYEELYLSDYDAPLQNASPKKASIKISNSQN
jgi:hypothetical protein